MPIKMLTFLGLIFMVSVQAKYTFTDKGKACVHETGTDEDTIRDIMITDTGRVSEDNEFVQKFLECCMRDFITDTNQIIVDDKFMTYITAIFTHRLDGRHKMAKLLARDCIDHCKDITGDDKGKTAVKVTNCLMVRLQEYREKN